MAATPGSITKTGDELAGARLAVEDAAPRDEPSTNGAPAPARRRLKLSTVSHTLDRATAERLRHFAFRERISESAVIEYALRELFVERDDARLGRRLRELGAGLRRKS